jgi:hypothetical protein
VSGRRPRAGRVLLLTAVLVALRFGIGVGLGFTADEWPLLQQAELVRAGTWSYPAPWPEIDPEGRFRADSLAAQTVDDRIIPYGKHPAAPVTIAVARAVGGLTGALLVSLAGLVAAASGVAAVVRRVAPSAESAAFWVTGLGSALVVHGFVLWFHAWGVALAAVAVVAALGLVRGGASRPAWYLAGALVVLPLYRSEGVLLGVALAVALAVVLRDRPGVAARTAGIAAAATAIGLTIDRALAGAVGAGEVSVPAADGGVGYLAGRVTGAVATLVDPGYDPAMAVVRLVAVAVTVAGVWIATSGGRPAAGRSLVVAGSVVAVSALAVPPWHVPGLLPAFPVIAAGLLVVARPDDASGRLLATTVLVGIGLLVATVYPGGGGGDWGGRYALVLLPALAGLVAPGLVGLPDRLGKPTATLMVAALLAVTATAAVNGPRALSRVVDGVHHFDRLLEEAMVEARPGPAGRPVAVAATLRGGRQLAYREDRLTPFHAADAAERAELLGRLDRAGVTEVVLLTSEAPELPPGWRVRWSARSTTEGQLSIVSSVRDQPAGGA